MLSAFQAWDVKWITSGLLGLAERLDLASSQADAHQLAVNFNGCPLQIGAEQALGLDLREADVVANLGALGKLAARLVINLTLWHDRLSSLVLMRCYCSERSGEGQG